VTEMGAPLPLPANCVADTPWLLDVYYWRKISYYNPVFFNFLLKKT
jgi:hypothetical protein